MNNNIKACYSVTACYLVHFQEKRDSFIVNECEAIPKAPWLQWFIQRRFA